MNYEVISIETVRIMADIEKENKELQQIIDKAIEYIKQNYYVEPKELYGLVSADELLNILQGGNNE